MRVWAEVNLDNLKENIKIINEISGNRRIMGIVKADGYGHGAIEMASELSLLGVSIFGVAGVDEAEELVKNKINGDILILGCTFIEDWKQAVSLGVQLTLSSYEELEYLKKSKIHPKIHIKVDTGMGRIGFDITELENVIKIIQADNLAEIEGVFTHLSVADMDIEYTKKQVDKFEMIVKKHKEIKYIHASNSAGILNDSDNFNTIRPGLILYGISPIKSKISSKLLPLLTLKSKVSLIKELKKDTYISYGNSYLGKSGEKIATISAGYADGVNRKMSNGGKVLIRGIKCEIVGRICMDQFMVRIPDLLSDLKTGEEVVIIGENLSVDELANKSDTISYEILTSLNKRVTRIYYKNNKIVETVSIIERKFFR